MPRVPRGRRGARRITAILTATTLAAGTLAVPPAQAAAGLRKADTGAAITGYQRLDANTFDIAVRSPSLGQTAKVRVITPKGWSPTSQQRWPVLYTFHGGADNYVSWTRSTDIEQVAARYNAMVVMPEGGANGSYTDWYNDGRGGTPKWETFHLREVVQLMERNYRAGNQRAAMGISSGGQGAITYAARFPGFFKYAASFSGIVHLTKPGIPAILMAQGFASDPSQNPFLIWGNLDQHAANWRAHDPYLLASRLRGTGLYLSSGTTGNPGRLDPPYVGWDFVKNRLLGGLSEAVAGSTNASLAARLKQLRIPVTTHIYGDGWHQWGYWTEEMHTTYPLMMKAIGAKRVA
ncbi:alpha/beta hydrolase [Spirillospora albida]|uniref:alpha/beta hydrolase n=1 Tax=Spirillospora albida TaxID=58123 RepID=UPI0004BF1836|nr:alpha/beta hydrolase family protein [Spirillospora albida]